MLIILSVFFLVVWLIFFRFNWLPWTRGWKITVYSIAVAIALVVVGALQYYTPVSAKAVVEAHVQQVYPLVTGTVESVRVEQILLEAVRPAEEAAEAGVVASEQRGQWSPSFPQLDMPIGSLDHHHSTGFAFKNSRGWALF